mgnify:CR=1 FL=1
MQTSNAIIVCSFCNEYGHHISVCQTLKNVVCPICRKNGHTKKKCPVLNTRCGMCTEFGHIAIDCELNDLNDFYDTYGKTHSVSAAPKKNTIKEVSSPKSTAWGDSSIEDNLWDSDDDCFSTLDDVWEE